MSLGANYPLGGGTIKGQVAYRDMDNTENVDFNRWFVAMGYDYPMSKRTSFFAMTGFSQEKWKPPHVKLRRTALNSPPVFCIASNSSRAFGMNA